MKAPYIRNVDQAIVALKTVGATFLTLAQDTSITAIDRFYAIATLKNKDITHFGGSATEAMKNLVEEVYSQVEEFISPDKNAK